MKAITTRILRAVIEICVSKQTSAIYFFKVGMTNMKCQNKRQNKTNFNLSCCFRGIYNCCKHSLNVSWPVRLIPGKLLSTTFWWNLLSPQTIVF
jgi:hypothetical protein